MIDALFDRAQRELGSRAASAAAIPGFVLTAMVAERLREREQAALLAAREAVESGAAAAMGPLLAAAAVELRLLLPRVLSMLRASGKLPSPIPHRPFWGEAFLQRLGHLVVERLLVHAAAPPLLVVPGGLEGLPGADEHLQVAVIFDQPLAITHELYPLWTDAYVANQGPRSARPLEVLGVHVSWLDDQARMGRAIRFDERRDAFTEADLNPSRVPGVALVLACSAATHQHLQARLQRARVTCVNSATLAALADDKWSCWQRWKDAGVPTPTTTLLPADMTDEALAVVLSQLAVSEDAPVSGWLIQPRHGTEGHGIHFVPHGPRRNQCLTEAWRSIRTTDDAIVRPRIGLLQVDTEAGPCAWDLRLNVCFDGTRHRATSAYVLRAATSGQWIASVSRGGQVVQYAWLEQATLVAAKPLSVPPRPWSAELLAAAVSVAEQAVTALGPLELAGVDVKFDPTSQGVRCSVLDVNPRPAGLLHATLLDSGEAGIAMPLWPRLGSLAARTTEPEASIPLRLSSAP